MALDVPECEGIATHELESRPMVIPMQAGDVTETQQRVAWWLVGLGILALVLLLSITTDAWGLFVLCTLVGTPEVVPLPWETNSLVGPLSRSQYTICCGTRYGPRPYDVGNARRAAASEPDGWTDFVEVPFNVISTVYFTDWNGDVLHQTSPAPAGPYRLSVHVLGRDAGAAAEWMPFDPEDGPEEEPAEVHLIQLFPGDDDEIVHKAEDVYGHTLRDAGQRSGQEVTP